MPPTCVNIDSLATNLRTLVGGEEVSGVQDGDDRFVVLLPSTSHTATSRTRWEPAGAGSWRHEDGEGE